MLNAILRWSFIAIFDLLLRSGFGLGVLYIPLYIYFVPPLTALNLVCLAFARGVSRCSQRSHAFRLSITLVVANALFAAATLALYLQSGRSGHYTVCAGNECSWVSGQLTWSGYRFVGLFELAQIAINAVVALVMDRISKPAPRSG